ncbi:hypothetical protein FQN55_008781 [Onygenales sp. PD_40]|nr:hypothetical protein FQN55_008781 [Onygenales sp. PD_40]
MESANAPNDKNPGRNPTPYNMTDPQMSIPESGTVAWAEVFSQHESNLTRHLEICGMVKRHVVPECPSFKAISSMVDRTHELLRQLEDLRIEFLLQNTASRILSGKSMNKVNEQRSANKEHEAHTRDTAPVSSSTTTGDAPVSSSSRDTGSTSIPSFFFERKPPPVAIPERLKSGKKRSLGDDNLSEMNHESSSNISGGKRKKLHTLSQDDVPNREDMSAGTPTHPVETEDISAEVERRLRMKEQRRRRRTNGREKKRKRVSTGSVDDNPGMESAPRRRAKRTKVHAASEQEGAPAAAPMDSGGKRQEKRRVSDSAYDSCREKSGNYAEAMYKKPRKS